jgi:hypothetical protein
MLLNLWILRECFNERRTMKIASGILTLANRDCDITDVKDGLAIAARVPGSAARSVGMIPKAKSLSSHGRRVVMLSKTLTRVFSKSRSLSMKIISMFKRKFQVCKDKRILSQMTYSARENDAGVLCPE